MANIGFTEGHEYELIESGALNPSLKLKPNTMRLNRIHGYIMLLQREYTMLKHRSILKHVPREIKLFIKEYEFKYDDLPDILVEYVQYQEHFRKHVEKAVNFSIETLYKEIIQLMKNNKQKELLKKFADYILSKILQEDKLYAKPTEVNLGLISDRGADQDVTYESEGEDDTSPEKTEPFSADGFDYNPEENEDHEYTQDY